MTCHRAKQAYRRTANTNEPAMVPEVPAVVAASGLPELPRGTTASPTDRRHADNIVANDAYRDCGHSPRVEMRAYDALPTPIRKAVREARFEWCALVVLERGFRWYSQAKRWLATQERAYVSGAK